MIFQSLLSVLSSPQGLSQLIFMINFSISSSNTLRCKQKLYYLVLMTVSDSRSLRDLISNWITLLVIKYFVISEGLVLHSSHTSINDLISLLLTQTSPVVLQRWSLHHFNLVWYCFVSLFLTDWWFLSVVLRRSRSFFLWSLSFITRFRSTSGSSRSHISPTLTHVDHICWE